MKIAVHGLGKMGIQIAEKLARDGHTLIAHNRSAGPIEQAAAFGAVAAYTKEDVLQQFGQDQVIVWLMLPAEVVESEIAAWLDIMPKGSILIDGGNTDFRKTQVHAETVAGRGSVLVDVGTSGGVWGIKNGFSMMVGGDANAVAAIDPVLQCLSLPNGAYRHFGPSGSGNYVKMVHNAIEYGMMESLAEGYRMLKEGPYDSLDLAMAGDVWQHSSVVTSWLNELTRDALVENPTLDGIDGFVAENGECRWTLEVAQERGIPLPAIQSAFDVRLASQQGQTSFTTKLLAAMRNKFGGHAINK